MRFGLLHPVCVVNPTTTTPDGDFCRGTSTLYQDFLTGGWISTAKGGTYLAQLKLSPAIVGLVILMSGAMVGTNAMSYTSCDQLRAADLKNLYGVARSKADARLTGAKVDPTLFAQVKKLDTDSDGVACERAVYDSGVTTSSRGAREAYTACKEYQTFNQIALNYSNQMSRYYNYVDILAVREIWYRQAATTMKQAAQLNPVFSDGATAADASAKAAATSVARARAGKDEYAPSRLDDRFNDWCAYLGVWERHPGIFPAVRLTIPSLPMTAINGAKSVCQDLFYGSPDGTMYSGYDKTTLGTCDKLARRVADLSDTYQQARDSMVDLVFGNGRESWCWGTKCKTKWDF
jgi:hypothetical protein